MATSPKTRSLEGSRSEGNVLKPELLLAQIDVCYSVDSCQTVLF